VKTTGYCLFLISWGISNRILQKNLPKIFLSLKKLGILCFDQKLPAKPKWSKNATTVFRKWLILKKLTRKRFFIIKASGYCGENFVKTGDDFGAGR
jgi:hypothetical protein